MKPFLSVVVSIGVCLAITRTTAQDIVIQQISPTSLQKVISVEKSPDINYDFILLDIRTFMDVAGGIIASNFCKPYHMSFGLEELQAHHSLLPKTIPIIIYCKTGTTAKDAANFLVNEGFTMVGFLAGGISAYMGPLSDSTEFKSWNRLPEPSYFGNTNSIMNEHPARLSVARWVGVDMFDLQGRIVFSHQISRFITPNFLVGRNGKNSFTFFKIHKMSSK